MAAPPYKGLSGPASIEIAVEVGGDKRVQVNGKTNLPPGTDLLIEIVEKRPDVHFGPGDTVKVQPDCTFQTRWISKGSSPFPEGRYLAKVLMPVFYVQPKNVQPYFGDSGSLLTGPLVEQTPGDVKVVRAHKEFVIGAPDDGRVELEIAQEKELVMKWVQRVTNFKATLHEFPILTVFRRNRQAIEDLEALYLKEAEAIRQIHFKVAIASVFVDLRVMAQSSDNAEFDLQLQEYWRNVQSLEELVKDAHYEN